MKIASHATPRDVRPRLANESEQEVVRGDGGVMWDALVPLIVHPTKVGVIRALASIGEPLSPTDLFELLSAADESLKPASVDWHVKALVDAGVLVLAHQKKVRNTVRSFYFISPSLLRG